MSKLQENNILQTSKLAKFCQQNCMNVLASSENNQSLCSIADFSVRFTALSERNVSLQKEKSNVSWRWIGVKLFHFQILMMCQSICFSRLLLLCSFSCFWSHIKIDYVSCRLQNYYFLFCFFLKRSWRCNFPPNKSGRQHSWPCIFPP